MTRRLFLVLATFCASTSLAQAQTDTSEDKTDRVLQVTMEVKDHMTHEGIDSTLTAQLLNAADSAFIDSVKTSVDKWRGKFYSSVNAKISQPGDYIIRLQADGYAPKYVPFSIPKLYKRERYRELKTTYLQKQKQKWDVDLDEVVVTATKLKFFMDGDTLTYNADAFSLSEGSMIDALIKKLPGVEIKDGGEIYVNGQKVESLLLNGKDFFDSDRELMLENMPAYMVKNIQSYERVPEDVKGTNKEKTAKKELVMNVKLKREYNRGWMANAEGGIGTDFYADDKGNTGTKFMGRLFGLRFDDRSRLMVYANANNLNDDRTPGQEGEWSPLTQSQGLKENYSAGTNYSIGDWDHIRYQASANASYSENYDAYNNSQQTFLKGGDTFGRSYYDRRSYNVNMNTYHMFRYRTPEPGDWYKNITAFIQPYFNYMKWNNHASTGSTTLAEDVAEGLGKAWMDSIAAPNAGELLKKYAINRTLNSTKGSGHWTNFNIRERLSYSPAHNDMLEFTLSSNYTTTDRKEDSFEHYRVDYPNSKTGQATDFRNRFIPSTDHSSNFSIEPEVSIIFERNDSLHHRFWLGYEYSHNSQRTNRSLYLLNKLNGWGEGTDKPISMLPSEEEMLTTLDADNSSRSHNTVATHNAEFSYSLVQHTDSMYREWYVELELPFKKETLDYWQGTQADTIFSRNTAFLTPRIGFWSDKYSRGQTISIDYSMNTSTPSMSSLLNIKTTSDPLNTVEGNPNLKNTRTHNLGGNYRDKFGRGILFNANARASITQDAIAYGYIYNKETGKRTIMPENVNGNWSMNVGTGVDFPFDKGEKWRLRERVSYNYNHSVDLNGTSEEMVATRSVVGSSYLNNELGLNFRPSDKMEFGAKGNFHYQHSGSDRTDFTTINVYDYDYGITAQVELPWKIQLSTDVTMYSRRGYTDESMNTDEFVWNARLTKKFMNGNLLIHFDAFDLLGKLSNVRRSINAQGKSETFYNVIPSYGLMHIAYRFNKTPKKKEN